MHHNYKNSPWTDEISARAHVMWDAGDSARTIADAISTSEVPISRNAVIGRAHRKMWGGRPRAPAVIKEPRERKKRGPRPHRARYLTPTSMMLFGPVDPTPIVEPDVTNMQLVSFADRKADGCCWPIGDPRDAGFGFGFCDSDRVEGSSYCAGHTYISIQHISPPMRYARRRSLYR